MYNNRQFKVIAKAALSFFEIINKKVLWKEINALHLHPHREVEQR